jgi:hypothetical protein
MTIAATVQIAKRVAPRCSDSRGSFAALLLRASSEH